MLPEGEKVGGGAEEGHGGDGEDAGALEGGVSGGELLPLACHWTEVCDALLLLLV